MSTPNNMVKQVGPLPDSEKRTGPLPDALTESNDLSDLEALEALIEDEKEPDKVCRDVAREDFFRVLKTWKVLKKARKKLKSKDEEIREALEEGLETALDAIQDGSLVVEKAGPFGVKLIHMLHNPITDSRGEVICDRLEYKRTPRVVDLRKMDQFEDKEQIAKMQALAAAMSGKSVPELANLSGAEIDILGALLVFFV